MTGSNGGEIAALGTPLAALAGMGIVGISNVETDFFLMAKWTFGKPLAVVQAVH